MRHFQEGKPSWRGTQAPQAQPLSAWQAAPRAGEEPVGPGRVCLDGAGAPPAQGPARAGILGWSPETESPEASVATPLSD